MDSLKFDPLHLSAFNKNWGAFLVWGILLVVLGTIAIGMATITSLVKDLRLYHSFKQSFISMHLRFMKMERFFSSYCKVVFIFNCGILLVKNPMLTH